MKINRVLGQFKIILKTVCDGAPAKNVRYRVSLESLCTQRRERQGGAADLADIDRKKFEKEGRSNAMRNKEGEVTIQVPRSAEVENAGTLFPCYLVELLGIDGAPAVSRPADAQDARCADPSNLMAVYELNFGDLVLPDGSMTEPFERYADKLACGNAVGLDSVGELPKGDGDILFDFFEVAIGIPPPRCDEARRRLARLARDASGSTGRTKTFDDTVHTLVSNGSEIYWRAPRAPLPDADFNFVNNGFEWLTYETILNKAKFRKTNQALRYGLYTLPAGDLTVFIRNRIAPDLLRVLADGFFPDEQASDVEAASTARWHWKNAGYTSTEGPSSPRAPQRVDLSRDTGAIHHADPRVVLPYNYYDNHDLSCALGTSRHATLGNPGARQLDRHWSFWKTASRSSVARLERVKPQAQPWIRAEADPIWQGWPFWKGIEKRHYTVLADEASRAESFRTADLGSGYVSLKTGVCYVGREDQSAEKVGPESCKDFIDSNWIVACLRSDYIVETDAAVGGRDDRMLVLTELLSITEKARREPPNKDIPYVRDGVQVRDLSPMSAERVYVFPGSVPYLGEDHKTLATAYSAASSSVAWRVFWRAHWAAGLGRAKALFLLRYGLQHINPNPQNYLIELRKTGDGRIVGPGRIVIRDLQDASLHREVQWALFGPAGQQPPTTTDMGQIRGLLRDAFQRCARDRPADRQLARILQYEFEHVDEDDFQETGTTPDAFRGPGTKLGWASFSAGVCLDKPGWLQDLQREAGSEQRMDEIINLLADWGFAHAIAWVRCMESELGHEFRGIDWRKLPSLEVKAPNSEEAVVADVIHAFLGAEGAEKLRAYRRNRWAAPAVARTLTVCTEVEDRPAPWSLIEFRQGTTTWLRPTDDVGRIPLFEPLADTVEFTRLLWCGRYVRDNGLKWERREGWKRVPLVRDGLTLRPRN